MSSAPEIGHQFIESNGIRLHLATAGPKDGRPVLFLHGFPDFWYGWRKQIPFFAKTGLRVLAPDQRGYNLSDKPTGRAPYALDELAADMVGLIDQLDYEKVCLVGHDWGAGVAWWMAEHTPDRVEKLAILNVPHGEVMKDTIRHQFSQFKKSWYIFFFQIPWLPEWLCQRNNYQLMARALIGSSRPGTFTPGDLAEYRQAWSQPGSLTAMINWYRAYVQSPPSKSPGSSHEMVFRDQVTADHEKRIHVPTTIIWGAQDRFLNRSMAKASAALCDNASLVYFEEASHWVKDEEADSVNNLLLNFFKS